MENETSSSNSESATSSSPPGLASDKQNPSEPHVASWLIILLIGVFEPIAMYLMYKEKRYHGWFAYLLWLHVGLSLIVYTIFLLFVVPQVETLYKNLDISHSYTTFFIASAVLISLSVAQIIVGILLYKKIKKPNASYNKLLKISIGLLIANLLVVNFALGSSILSVITPIYSIADSLK